MCVLVSISIIVCFLTYAFAEKMGNQESFFYGKLEFSFVDHSYAERFGYFLELFTASMFAAFAWAHKKSAWLSWSIIFLILFLDDFAGIHEMFGRTFVASGLLYDAGEIAGFSILGCFICFFWWRGFTKLRDDADQKLNYLLFTVYFAALLFFGIVMDGFHSFLTKSYDVSETIMTLMEDGLELLMLNVAAISSLGHWNVFRKHLHWK